MLAKNKANKKNEPHSEYVCCSISQPEENMGQEPGYSVEASPQEWAKHWLQHYGKVLPALGKRLLGGKGRQKDS